MKKPSLQQRLKTTPGLLDRYRADPGLRSKLPDRMLTPDQRGVRKRQTTQRLIGQPLASLQGTTLQDLAREVTRGEYDPLYRDNDKQRGVANRETGALADRAQAYYDALNKANDARTAQQKAATGEQDTALQGIGTTAQAAIDKARGEGEQRIQQDAQLRGGGLQADAVQNLAARMAEASARSAEGTRIDRGAGQKHGFNAETFARSSATAGAMRGGETQGDIARRGQGILSQITDARTDLGTRERGDYTKTLLGLRDRQAEIELGKAQILGSQTAAQVKAEADAASDAAKLAEARRERLFKGRENARDRELTASEKAADRASREGASSYKGAAGKDGKRPRTGLGSLTQEQENAIHDRIGSAETLGRKLKAGGIDETLVRRILLDGQNTKTSDGQTIKTPAYPKEYVNAVMDLIYRDGLSRSNVKALHRRGVHVGGRYKLLGSAPRRSPNTYGGGAPQNAAKTVLDALGR